jgi:hypothetical protein
MNACARTKRHVTALPLLVVAIVAAIAILPAAVAAQAESVTIPLNELDVPGVSGTATLTANGDGTDVEMMLSGPGVTGDHPTHIHTGTCDDFDPNPLYPLTTVILDPVDDQGESATEVDDVSLDELLADDFVILVHQSMDELTTYLVCGEIVQTASTPSTPAMPVTGVGSAIQDSLDAWYLVLGATVVLFVAAGLGFRFRVARVGR